jgi:nitrogen regulatory protein PII
VRKIEAVLEAFQLDDVKQELELIGVHGMTVAEVKGSNGSTGLTYRAAAYSSLPPKVRVEIAVEDDFADAVVRRLLVAVNRIRSSDGVILVLPMDDAVRIRTGEHGGDAV